MCTLALAGAGLQGISAVMGLQAKAANSKMQQALSDRQAKIEDATGLYNATRHEEKINQVLGQQVAAAGASGMSTDTEVAADTLSEGDLDIRAIRWQSNLAADTNRFEAKMHGVNAKQSRSAMPFAFAAPLIGELGSFASSFSGGGSGGGATGR